MRFFSLVLFVFCSGVFGQGYPSKPIRYIVPFPPGGSSDLISRAIAPRLSERLGQPVVIENLPGAGAMLGVERVARSAPDGYTIGLAAAGALSSNIHLYPRMPFDPEKDLAHITPLALIPFFLIAHPSQASSVKDLLEEAKAKPGALSYGAGGNGSTMHLAGELLNMLGHVNIQVIPFKGSGPVAAAVLGNQVPYGVVDVPAALSNVRAGKLRALAVTSKQRVAVAPEVPTFEEAGVAGYEAVGWFGVVGPAGLPNDILMQLNREIAAALASPDIRKIAIDAGTEPYTSSPQQFTAMIRAETKKWGDVIKAGNIRLD
jgi:tripartite-type tricarboxylate transporter receptor subunit TctC